jgi:hypothetical protein
MSPTEAVFKRSIYSDRPEPGSVKMIVQSEDARFALGF